MDYFRWNNLVADHLFKPSRAGQEVFLYLTEDDLVQAVRSGAEKPGAHSTVLELASKERPAILNNLWNALRRGPMFWETLPNGKHFFMLGEDFLDFVSRDAPRHPAELAKCACDDWKHATLVEDAPGTRIVQYQGKAKLRLTAPLHLLYLACFTMPFSIADAVVSGNGYYDCWNTFFGSPRNLLKNNVPMSGNALAQLGNAWVEMWQELNRWSQEDLRGERGILVARKLGSHVHVGWPRAQCLLPPAVLSKLPGFFGRHNLLPGMQSTVEKMRGLLMMDNSGLDLPTATRQELQKNSELGQAVVDMTLKVLRRWTGSTNRRERVQRSGGQVQTVELRGETYASLRPFLPLDILDVEALTWHYRLHIKTPLPEDLKLTGPGLAQVAVQPETNEWSREVEGVVASASAQVFYDQVNSWKVVAQLPDIQVFIPGGRYSFHQWWAPVQALEHGTQLLLLCRQGHSEVVRGWGREVGAVNFEDYSAFGGVPDGYSLFWLRSLPANAVGLSGVEVASETRIVVEGGLSCGNRTYLDELPPAFRLINAQANNNLWLAYVAGGEAMPLVPDANDQGLWQLPAGIRTGERFRIVVEGEAELDSLPYSLHAGSLPKVYSAPLRGAYGQIVDVEEAELYYDGSCIRGELPLVKQLRQHQQPYIFHFTPGF